MNTWPPDADPKAAYLCFTIDMDEDQAAARFQQKHGAPPERIIEAWNRLWLGPINGGKNHDKQMQS